MKILRSYVLTECIVPFILSLIVLTCVFLLGNLINLANLVINKGVSLTTIGKAFVLYIPVLVGYTLPIACLIGVILAFSRMSSDNEILAMRASGIHLSQLLFPLMIVGLMISLFSFVLNDRIIPYAHDEQRKIIKSLGTSNPTALLEPGMFINSFDKFILFIHKIDGNKMYNVTIYQPRENKPTRTIIAKKGEFAPIPGSDQIKLKLIDGTADEPNLQNPDNFYKLSFKQYFMTLDLSQKNQTVDKKPKSMTLKELENEMIRLERFYIKDTGKLRTEYFRKITFSFAPFFFILLGFPLAVITNKREKSANVVLAIICVAIYYLLSLGCEALGIKNVVDPAVIMWGPNLVAAVAAVILNIRCVS